MKKAAIIEFFEQGERGVRKTAEAFGITTQAVYQWPDIVHKRIALEAEKLSDGTLKYDPREY